MMASFDSNIVFPLFEGPLTQAIIEQVGECRTCNSEKSPLFDGRCYECFREGSEDYVIDTELGMVTYPDAKEGRTHGLPLDNLNNFQGFVLTPHPVDPNYPEEKWYHFDIESDHLLELLRTPKYSTWQGEQWLFCCMIPMVFCGSIPASIIDHDPNRIEGTLQNPDWDRIESHADDSTLYHTFECRTCFSTRWHVDYS